jgi:20S proteasome alpha/beta subunit
MKGGTIIGACSDRAAVILTWSPVPKNSLPIRKIHRITKMCGVSSSGIVSDVHFVTNKLFEDSLDHVQLFGSETPAIRAATNIANYVHERTLSVRYRPLGIRMCIASYDETSKGSILEIDAMGNLNRCRVACIGPHADKLLSKWQAKTPSSVGAADAADESSQWGPAELIEATLDVLRSCLEDSEEGVKVEAGDVSIAYVASSTPFAVIEHGDEVLEAAMVRRDFSLLRQRCLGQQQQQNNLSS